MNTHEPTQTTAPSNDQRLPTVEFHHRPTLMPTAQLPDTIEYDCSSDTPVANAAERVLRTRYPKKGRAFNRVSNMTCVVLGGRGWFEWTGKDGSPQSRPISQHDIIFVEKDLKYAWQPDVSNRLHLLIISSPPWTAEQHGDVEE